MRIAYVSMDPGIPVFGTKGASIHVQSMVRAFLALGAEVTLISPRTEGTPMPVRVVSIPVTGSGAERTDALLAANRTLADVLADEGPFDLIYERHALYAHAATEFAAAHAIPSVLEINAPLIEEQSRHRTLTHPAQANDTARRSLSAATAVVAVSAAVAEYARGHGAKRVEVIPNAIDPARQALPHVPGPFTVGFLGSLRPWHDIGVLLDAVAILQTRIPAHLLIIGDGPDRERLAPRLTAIGAEVTGMVPHSDLAQHLARLDVAVAPYSASQPFYFSPLKLFDYMGAALPIVASRVGDLEDLLQGHGVMCEPDDPQALADVLERLAGDAALRADLGRAARAHVMAHHTWDRVAQKVLELAA
ncbi:glycosyltransferase family 4 protein [Falsirhodobacter xinxiangensis]|uniref:glycosyltransferase family 4 protein n=1 Tax=Falsirhodobacter xinxiangensis TaxID=2530049 RepID=UPI0010AB3040|nr:glycosyltransferase family 4 protein [Rhodobacter xinxiangensis]